MLQRRLGTISSLILTLIIIVGAGTVHVQSTPEVAVSPPVFTLQPKESPEAYVTLVVELGTTTETTILLGAEAESTVPAITYAADACSLINGGFSVREYGEPSSAPTTWLDDQTETLELEPGLLIERTLVVTVPADTQPGQYIAALSNATPTAGGTVTYNTCTTPLATS
ncbi:MAG: hypothetical protein WKF81_12735, partial [Thermomicrobiales bacterium]